MFEEFNFKPGEITYNDFDVNPELPLYDERNILKEDMFQVVYPNNIILDIGWYSGVKKFIIFIIKDEDWWKPVEKIMVDNLDDLKREVQDCITRIARLT